MILRVPNEIVFFRLSSIFLGSSASSSAPRGSNFSRFFPPLIRCFESFDLCSFPLGEYFLPLFCLARSFVGSFLSVFSFLSAFEELFSAFEVLVLDGPDLSRRFELSSLAFFAFHRFFDSFACDLALLAILCISFSMLCCEDFALFSLSLTCRFNFVRLDIALSAACLWLALAPFLVSLFSPSKMYIDMATLELSFLIHQLFFGVRLFHSPYRLKFSPSSSIFEILLLCSILEN